MRVFVNENEKKETFPSEPITGLELIPLRLFRFIPAYIYNIFIIVAYIYCVYARCQCCCAAEEYNSAYNIM